MAEPIQFPQSNSTWTGEGEIENLPAYLNDGVSVSCWKLTKAELEEVRRTGVVWLSVWGGHPPVNISGKSPFDNEEGDGL